MRLLGPPSRPANLRAVDNRNNQVDYVTGSSARIAHVSRTARARRQQQPASQTSTVPPPVDEAASRPSNNPSFPSATSRRCRPLARSQASLPAARQAGRISRLSPREGGGGGGVAGRVSSRSSLVSRNASVSRAPNERNNRRPATVAPCLLRSKSSGAKERRELAIYTKATNRQPRSRVTTARAH